MKKALSIILMLLFFGDAAAPPTVFAIVKSKAEREARRAIERGVPERELNKFSEGARDFSGAAWVKPQKEFILKGSFYDVIRIERAKGKKTYFCLNDTKEKSLFKKYSSVIRGAFSNKLANNKLVRLALKKLVGYRIYSPFILTAESFRIPGNFEGVERLLSHPADPPAPPPRCY